MTDAKAAVKREYDLLGWHALLETPPVDNTMNIIDHALSNSFAQK
jgi:hypothetical protein